MALVSFKENRIYEYIDNKWAYYTQVDHESAEGNRRRKDSRRKLLSAYPIRTSLGVERPKHCGYESRRELVDKTVGFATCIWRIYHVSKDRPFCL